MCVSVSVSVCVCVCVCVCVFRFCLHQGDTVRWVWDDSAPLNVLSGASRIPNGVFASGDPSFTGAFEYTFLETGRFEYFSQLQTA